MAVHEIRDIKLWAKECEQRQNRAAVPQRGKQGVWNVPTTSLLWGEGGRLSLFVSCWTVTPGVYFMSYKMGINYVMNKRRATSGSERVRGMGDGVQLHEQSLCSQLYERLRLHRDFQQINSR